MRWWMKWLKDMVWMLWTYARARRMNREEVIASLDRLDKIKNER